ncbi:hypothetical protein ENBRE01_2906 [Enteropsectra breve]|nr:hypothetical protein ENBRE01_2906 [Enteropsectra breve]
MALPEHELNMSCDFDILYVYKNVEKRHSLLKHISRIESVDPDVVLNCFEHVERNVLQELGYASSDAEMAYLLERVSLRADKNDYKNDYKNDCKNDDNEANKSDDKSDDNEKYASERDIIEELSQEIKNFSLEEKKNAPLFFCNNLDVLLKPLIGSIRRYCLKLIYVVFDIKGINHFDLFFKFCEDKSDGLVELHFLSAQIKSKMEKKGLLNEELKRSDINEMMEGKPFKYRRETQQAKEVSEPVPNENILVKNNARDSNMNEANSNENQDKTSTVCETINDISNINSEDTSFVGAEDTPFVKSENTSFAKSEDTFFANSEDSLAASNDISKEHVSFKKLNAESHLSEAKKLLMQFRKTDPSFFIEYASYILTLQYDKDILARYLECYSHPEFARSLFKFKKVPFYYYKNVDIEHLLVTEEDLERGRWLTRFKDNMKDIATGALFVTENDASAHSMQSIDINNETRMNANPYTLKGFIEYSIATFNNINSNIYNYILIPINLKYFVEKYRNRNLFFIFEGLIKCRIEQVEGEVMRILMSDIELYLSVFYANTAKESNSMINDNNYTKEDSGKITAYSDINKMEGHSGINKMEEHSGNSKIEAHSDMKNSAKDDAGSTVIMRDKVNPGDIVNKKSIDFTDSSAGFNKLKWKLNFNRKINTKRGMFNTIEWLVLKRETGAMAEIRELKGELRGDLCVMEDEEVFNEILFDFYNPESFASLEKEISEYLLSEIGTRVYFSSDAQSKRGYEHKTCELMDESFDDNELSADAHSSANSMAEKDTIQNNTYEKDNSAIKEENKNSSDKNSIEKNNIEKNSSDKNNSEYVRGSINSWLCAAAFSSRNGAELVIRHWRAIFGCVDIDTRDMILRGIKSMDKCKWRVVKALIEEYKNGFSEFLEKKWLVDRYRNSKVYTIRKMISELETDKI